MKRLIRLGLILGIACIVLLSLIAGGASWWIMRKLGPEMWVQQIEQHTQCRAEIADASLSFFSTPARLALKGVKLAPRDAETAKPPAQRTPLPEGAAPVHIPEVVLEVRLEDLLNRRLLVEKLQFITPVVSESIDARGHSTLEALFQPADVEAGTPDVPKAVPVSPDGQPMPRPAPPEASEAGYSFSVKSAVIENGSLTIRNAGNTVAITELDFELSGIDIDPGDLAAHNKMTAKLSAAALVTGQARIAGARRQATLADVRLSGISQITPLHPTTGQWQPSSILKLTLERGSIIAGHMTMGDAAGKEMRKLQEYGIDLAPVRVGGPLQEAAVVEGSFQANRFSLIQDARFAFPEYEVALQRKSYVNAAADQHEIELRLSCGPELQARLQQGLARAKLGDSITRGIMKALADERGRMAFDIESEGSLSDPQIKPKVDRIFKNLIRGEGLGDLLQGLLKKL